MVPLGWGIFGWVSRFAIIPMFDFFSSFISNFGVIILLMTIVIKLVLFPLTYKSYVSSAKMRVLKPEIDEINERIPPEKAAERQKATMELYNKVGVSPFSGCIPTLLQMPILFAMFMFFPSSIELREKVSFGQKIYHPMMPSSLAGTFTFLLFPNFMVIILACLLY